MIALALALALAQAPVLTAGQVRSCNAVAGAMSALSPGLPSFPCGPTSPLLTGLVAYFAFQNNTDDSTGANNGTPTNMSYATGIIGQAGNFNGTSYVSVPNPASFRSTTFSVSAWINTVTTAEQDIFESWDIAAGPTYNGFEFRIFLPSTRVAIGHGPFSYYDSPAVFAVSTWYHLVLVVSTLPVPAFSVYRNGTLLYTSGIITPVFSSNTRVRIGVNEYQAGLFAYYFTGRIDELGYWSRALTAAEVLQLYNGGAGITYPF